MATGAFIKWIFWVDGAGYWWEDGDGDGGGGGKVLMVLIVERGSVCAGLNRILFER